MTGPGESRSATPDLHGLLREADSLLQIDAQRALALAEQAGQLARTHGELRAEGAALSLQAAALHALSLFAEARARNTGALGVARQVKDPITEARALTGLGNVAKAFGEYGESMEFYLESLRLTQEHADEMGRLRVVSNIGLIHWELGDYELALQSHLGVIESARRLRHFIGESSGIVNAMVSTHYLGRHEQVLAVAEEHLPVLRERGVRQHELVLQSYRALSLLETGRAREALGLVQQEVMPLAHVVQDRTYIAMNHVTLGRAHLQLHADDPAERELRQALTVARESGLRSQERDALQHLHQLHARQGRWEAAYAHLNAYHRLERLLHAQELDRKAKVLSTQMQVEMLRRDAEAERLRNAELSQANQALEQARQGLAYRATHDPLTGLANRSHFQAQAERQLLEHPDTVTAVLFIDLDGFKQINDSLGHEIGDQLLVQVARRFRDHVRSQDLVARLGGDEFTVLLAGLREPPDAERIANKLLGVLSADFTLAERRLSVAASIGVAVAPRDGLDVHTLLRHADVAMYRAKRLGKNVVQAFGPPPGGTASTTT